CRLIVIRYFPSERRGNTRTAVARATACRATDEGVTSATHGTCGSSAAPPDGRRVPDARRRRGRGARRRLGWRGRRGRTCRRRLRGDVDRLRLRDLLEP